MCWLTYLPLSNNEDVPPSLCYNGNLYFLENKIKTLPGDVVYTAKITSTISPDKTPEEDKESNVLPINSTILFVNNDVTHIYSYDDTSDMYFCFEIELIEPTTISDPINGITVSFTPELMYNDKIYTIKSKSTYSFFPFRKTELFYTTAELSYFDKPTDNLSSNFLPIGTRLSVDENNEYIYCFHHYYFILEPML